MFRCVPCSRTRTRNNGTRDCLEQNAYVLKWSAFAQGFWYDDGLDLYDTRSGAFYIKEWEKLLEHADTLRDATSAQVDLNNLCAKNQFWYKSSSKWNSEMETRNGS